MNETSIHEKFVELFTDDPINWLKWGIVFAVLIVGYILAIPLYKKVSYRISWKRKRDIAISQKHVIQATLVDKHPTGEPANYDWYAKYSYSINGVKKTYRAFFKHPQSPLHTVSLLYLNNPKKLFCYEEYHWQNHKAIILLPIIVLPWILACSAMVLLGIPLS